MKKYLLIFTLIYSLYGFSQKQYLDSLYGVWQNKTKSDSERVGAYMSYVWIGYASKSPIDAIFLSDSLHSFAKNHNYPKASAYGYHIQGVASYYMGNNSKALDYYKKTLAIYEDMGVDDGIAASLNNIGNIHDELGNYSRSLDYYKQSLAIYRKIGFKENIAITLGNIGDVYNQQGNYKLALEYNKEALIIQNEIKDKKGIALSIKFIGDIYTKKKDYLTALNNYLKGLKIFKEIQDSNGLTTAYVDVGTTYQKKGKTKLAIEYCKKGLDLAKEIKALYSQKLASKCLYNSYKDLNKGNIALLYLEKLNIITDSLKSEETAKKLEQLEYGKIMFQDSITKAKEKRRINELHLEEMRIEEKNRDISIGIGFFFILLAIGFYTRWRYVKKSKVVLQNEKDRSENLLLNILPEEIAQELKDNGKAKARKFDNVSILFTDFIGFTEQSANLSAIDLVKEINVCFEAFDGIMENFSLEKIKTIGDSYMAAGGLPVPTKNSLKNTVLAALEMQEFIINRKAQNDAQNKPAFMMRVGIHSGPVVAGIVGVKKFQYDIWGDTVNTASRIESSGVAGRVNISQAIYEIIKENNDFIFEKRGMIQAKGKGKVEMYFVKLKD